VISSEDLRDAGAERVDELDHQLATMPAVLISVGADHPLVDPPGGLDLGVGVVGEQRGEPVDLLVGEEVCSGVQGAARGVERVALAATVAVDRQLDPAAQ
jgi:hypothetical protein